MGAESSSQERSTANVAQCYFPNGASTDAYVPCDTTAQFSACCNSTDECLTNGMCRSASDTGWTTTVYRDACTDPTWESDSCPKYCVNGSATNAITNGQAWISACSWNTYCCSDVLSWAGNNVALCCSDPAAIFVAPPAEWQSGPKLVTQVFPSPTSTGSATSSAQTNSAIFSTDSPSKTTSPSSPSSFSPSSSSSSSAGLSTGTKTAIGIAAGIAVVALIGAIATGWILYRLRHERKRWSESLEGTVGLHSPPREVQGAIGSNGASSASIDLAQGEYSHYEPAGGERLARLQSSATRNHQSRGAYELGSQRDWTLLRGREAEME